MEDSLASGVIPVSGDQGRGEALRGGASEGAAAGSRSLTMGIGRTVRHRRTAFRDLEVLASGRHPTPRQQARWEAVQAALREGLNLSAIARQVGIDRKTARRYAAALFQAPMNPPKKRSRDAGDDGAVDHELVGHELQVIHPDDLADLLSTASYERS